MKKSTLKIATESAGTGITPVIKIVQPAAQFNFDPNNIEDDDPTDDLIRTFLHTPCMVDRNEWFKLYTHFPVPTLDSPNPTHYVTTIAPLNERDLFFSFKHAIINRMIPYKDIVTINRNEVPVTDSKLERKIDISVAKLNKIEGFFQWIEETGRATWEEQQPTDVDGRPRN